MRESPDRSANDIKVAATAYSRGVAGLAVLSHLLYERGLVDDEGRVLIPPAQLGISAGVIYDPVATDMLGNVAFSAATQNVVVLQANDEYRYLFKGVDYALQEGMTTITIAGNHADIGGGYDNGIGALTLEGGTQFLQSSGVPIADIPAERRFDPTSPLIIHNEGIDDAGNRIWDTYGDYSTYQGQRLLDRRASPPEVTETPDGRKITFTDYANRKVTYEEEYGAGSSTSSLSIEDRQNWRTRTISSSDNWTTTELEVDVMSPPLEDYSDEADWTADGSPADQLADEFPYIDWEDEPKSDIEIAMSSDEGAQRWDHYLRTTSENDDGSLSVKTEVMDSDGFVDLMTQRTVSADKTSHVDFLDLNGDGQWESIVTAHQDENRDTHYAYSGFDQETHALLYQFEAGPGDQVTQIDRHGAIDASFADGTGFYSYMYGGAAYVSNVEGETVWASYDVNQTLVRQASGGFEIVPNNTEVDEFITLDPTGKVTSRENMNSFDNLALTDEPYIREEYRSDDGSLHRTTEYFDAGGQPERITGFMRGADFLSEQSLVDANADGHWEEITSDSWDYQGNHQHNESSYDPETQALKHRYTKSMQDGLETISEDIDGKGGADYVSTGRSDTASWEGWGESTEKRFNQDGSLASQ